MHNSIAKIKPVPVLSFVSYLLISDQIYLCKEKPKTGAMKIVKGASIVAPTLFSLVASFSPDSTNLISRSGLRSTDALALYAAPAKNVWIFPSETEVTEAVHKIVHDAASRAIAERGSFAMAIPGGSVLKVLSSMEGGDWVSKTTIAYINHKCVPNDDLSSAIHAKVRLIFLI